MCHCDEIEVRVKRVRGHDLPLPAYMTDQACAMDVYSVEENFTLAPGDSRVVGTGIAVQLPRGYRLEVCPRSGLAAKYAISVTNSPGLVDSDFRGEVGVILINHGKNPFEVRRGDRIAQISFTRYSVAKWVEVDELDETVRGSGGFGHTGR